MKPELLYRKIEQLHQLDEHALYNEAIRMVSDDIRALLSPYKTKKPTPALIETVKREFLAMVSRKKYQASWADKGFDVAVCAMPDVKGGVFLIYDGNLFYDFLQDYAGRLKVVTDEEEYLLEPLFKEEVKDGKLKSSRRKF